MCLDMSTLMQAPNGSCSMHSRRRTSVLSVARGEFWNLLFTICEFVKAYFNPSVEAKCLLVNSAIVEGLRDDERR